MRLSIDCVYGVLCVFLPFGCLLYYIYIYEMKQRRKTRCGSAVSVH